MGPVDKGGDGGVGWHCIWIWVWFGLVVVLPGDVDRGEGCVSSIL